MSANVLSDSAWQQIRRMIQKGIREVMGTPASPFTRHGGRRIRRHRGIMVTALDSATHAMTGPKFGCMRVLKRNHSTGDLETTSQLIKITNRWECIELEAGWFVSAEFLDGEWQVYAADCCNTGLPVDADGCAAVL